MYGMAHGVTVARAESWVSDKHAFLEFQRCTSMRTHTAEHDPAMVEGNALVVGESWPRPSKFGSTPLQRVLNCGRVRPKIDKMAASVCDKGRLL